MQQFFLSSWTEVIYKHRGRYGLRHLPQSRATGTLAAGLQAGLSKIARSMPLVHPILISRPSTQSDLSKVKIPRKRTDQGRDPNPPDRSIRRVTLHIEAGPHRGPRIRLPAHSSVRLGRTHGVELRLGGDTEMSREHAQIDVSPDEIRIFDLGSLNGTWVNWKRVGTAALQDGDVIEIGLTRLRLSIERA